jgi:hypothetical protein
MPLPKFFCWTRFGTEAGQSVQQIFARKEQERVANGGMFFWGIGNAIGPSMHALVRQTTSPEVVFSPIQCPAKREDASPSSVVAWTEAQAFSGEDYRLPERSLITSRFDALRPKPRHYALVCFSETPIAVESSSEHVHFAALRNLLTSRPVGASQVTAVVQLEAKAEHAGACSYQVAFRAQLVPPYLVSLRAPVPLASTETDCCWPEIVRKMWDGKRQSGAAA